MAESSGKAPKVADKYACAPPAYLIPNFQREWSDLAAKLFNTDASDILLTSEEKKQALALIAIPITSSSFGNKSRAQALHRTVSQAREMGQGKRPPANVTIIAALLIYTLEPPLTWWEWVTMQQPLGVLRYIRDCADGLSIYSSEGMLKAALAHSPAASTQDHSDSLFIVDKPSLKEANAKKSSTEHLEPAQLNSDRPALPALRPWTRSMTKFTTPSPPSEKRKAESESPHDKKTVPKKKVASPKKKAATPKWKTMAGSGTNPIPKAKNPNTRITEAVKRQQPIDNALLARYMKSAPMLDRIADYNDRSLIKDDDYESRAFLAEAIMNDVYKRINEFFEDVPQPPQLEDATHQPAQRPTEAKQTAKLSLDEQPMDTPTKQRSRSGPKHGKKSIQTKKRTTEIRRPKMNTLDAHNTPTKQASRPLRFSPSSRMSDDVFNDTSSVSAASPAAGRRHPNLASPPRFNIRGILSKRLKSKDNQI
ncbi:hypothetical protein CABS01_10383 [Colletotrichum abscissum]|uniref:Uncharacterized protein n=1 Tax=Colletotrichum abscissum TaxID=1671311 RepID=A0A9P9XN01_9PEZI|nr:uncharacterized protein CABS01_10383 [Colletotrichum abscissum]KAI3557167.1 hypothetical protein CABS02_02718 [Colletotrichum abscissum]KAK1499985.1 hypothetical protein CABS01_10383 [Colletotrichum abscissum]